MEQISLFPEYQQSEQKQQPRGRGRYLRPIELYGITEGKICGTCKHLKKHEYRDRNIYKCSQWINTASTATDIRLHNQACGKWEGV